MKKLFTYLMIIICVALFACSGAPMKDVEGGLAGLPDSGYYPSDEGEFAAIDAEYSAKFGAMLESYGLDVSRYYSETDGYDFSGLTEEEMGELLEEAKENLQRIMYGQLTASAVDDNLNYDYWLTLLQSGQSEEENGIFYSLAKEFAFYTSKRLKITVPAGTAESVTLKYKNKDSETLVPNRNGVAYFYPKQEQETYEVVVKYSENGTSKTISANVSGDYEFEYEGDFIYKDVIELMIVLDTTGSMGDEIRYLQAEIDNVIYRVKEANPNTTIRLAVLVYRDTQDVYLTKYSDFSENISIGREFLEKQQAAGGGDFEEAVEVALSEASKKGWSNDLSTKIILHVADAPAHDNKVSKWNNVCLDLASKGIRIINVASSGINKKTEYFFRSECLITNGIYTYLTNHSGIGGDHIEATTEEDVEVELLNSMLVRLINGMHTGTFAEPINYMQDVFASINNEE